MSRLLPPGSRTHEIALLFREPLPVRDLHEVLEPIEAGKRLVAVLDQITDPHNEGAILRPPPLRSGSPP